MFLEDFCLLTLRLLLVLLVGQPHPPLRLDLLLDLLLDHLLRLLALQELLEAPEGVVEGKVVLSLHLGGEENEGEDECNVCDPHDCLDHGCVEIKSVWPRVYLIYICVTHTLRRTLCFNICSAHLGLRVHPTLRDIRGY